MKKTNKKSKPPYQMAVDAINTRRKQEDTGNKVAAMRDKAASTIPGAAVRTNIRGTNEALLDMQQIHPGGTQLWRDMIPRVFEDGSVEKRYPDAPDARRKRMLGR